jgi:hypothetical protein
MRHWLVANPQQVFPLTKVTFEAHAFGNLKRCDQATLDLLAGLASRFAGAPILSPDW